MTKDNIMVYAIIYHDDSENGKKYVDIDTIHFLGEGLAETEDAVNYVLQLPRYTYELHSMQYSNICSKIYLFPDTISYDTLCKFPIDGLFYTSTANHITEEHIMYLNGDGASSLLVRRIEKNDLCTKCLRDDWMHLYKQLFYDQYFYNDINKLKERFDKIHFLGITEIIALPLLRLALALNCYDDTWKKVKKYLEDKCNYDFDVNCANLHLELLNKNPKNTNIVNAVITYSEPSPDVLESIIERRKELIRTSYTGEIDCPRSEKNIIRLMAVREALLRNAIILELHANNKSENKLAYQLFRQGEGNQSGNGYSRSNSSNDYKAIKVYRDLNRIREKINIDEKRSKVILKCTNIEFISQFPLGLIPLNKIPLLNQIAVTYKPLYPLYLTYPYLLERIPGGRISSECEIVFIECLDINDEVRKESDRVKEHLEAIIHNNLDNKIKFTYADQLTNRNDIENIINCNKNADIIYISAHGNAFKGYKREGDFEEKFDSICIGEKKDIWIPKNINDLYSKLVIISACHTSSRGIEGDNIADSLAIDFRAPCVLSPMISVKAKKNSDYMIRFFDHIFEQMDKHDNYLSIAEIWRKVTLEAIVYDLMDNNKNFEILMHQKKGESDILYDLFNQIQQNEKDHRLDFNVIDFIKEYVNDCLKDSSLSEKQINSIKDLFNSNRFFPEEYYYQLIGDADNVLVSWSF